MSESIVTVTIFDTSLRDGAQSLPEANQFPPGSKVEVAEHLGALGIGVIEAGFPRTRGDAEEVREIARIVGNQEYRVHTWQDGVQINEVAVTPVIAGLSRTTREDVDVAWNSVHAAKYPRIHTFVSTDAEHISAKFENKTPEEVLEMGIHAVRHAKELTMEHPGATVEFSAEAASTTDTEYLERVVKAAVDEGADVINLPDTVGQRNPFWMIQFYDRILGWVMSANQDVTVSAHNHNDLDMATTNSLSLVMSAANYARTNGVSVNTQIETTICGLGERAGNTDVFPLVAGLFKFSDEFSAPVEWQFNPTRSLLVARSVLAYAGLEVHRQNPIVGNDILVHRSGIHSDGVIKGGSGIYSPFDPRFWGHEVDARHEEGKYQGAKGRDYIAAHQA